jgi:hypothetical protein
MKPQIAALAVAVLLSFIGLSVWGQALYDVADKAPQQPQQPQAGAGQQQPHFWENKLKKFYDEMEPAIRRRSKGLVVQGAQGEPQQEEQSGEQEFPDPDVRAPAKPSGGNKAQQQEPPEVIQQRKHERWVRYYLGNNATDLAKKNGRLPYYVPDKDNHPVFDKVAWDIDHRKSEKGSAAKKVQNKIEVYFSSTGGCTEAAVKEIDGAKMTILVQAYSFTSAPIAKALVEAHKRGVDVWVILDKSPRTERYSEADFLVHMGIPTWIDARHAIAHNKVMVIDDKTVITGSFNFTKAAEESNAENMLIIRLPDIAAKYEANYQDHLAHSVKYEAKVAKQPSQLAVQGPTVDKTAQNAAKSWWDDCFCWLGSMAILALLVFGIERGFRWVKTGRKPPIQPPTPPKK